MCCSSEAAAAAMVVLVIIAIVCWWRANGNSGLQSGHVGSKLSDNLGGAPNTPCDQYGDCPYPLICGSNGCVSPRCDVNNPRSCWGIGTCLPLNGGTCVSRSTSCYSWNSFDTNSKVLPSNIIGYQPGAPLAPVGAQGADGKWYLGVTPASPTDPNWGHFTGSTPDSKGGNVSWKADRLWYLTIGNIDRCARAAILSGPETVWDPLLTFNGIPVCQDSSGRTGAFSPADSYGDCAQWAGMGTFQPIADKNLCAYSGIGCN